MKQEDEELLLKDLCMRMPYRVICKCYHTEFDEWDGKPFIAEYNHTLQNFDVNGFFLAGGFSYEIDEIKPYLRSMSSMTEEEEYWYYNFIDRKFYYESASELVEWLLKNHFDFRGLIEKGLAIEAPEGMYS